MFPEVENSRLKVEPPQFGTRPPKARQFTEGVEVGLGELGCAYAECKRKIEIMTA